MPTITLPAVVTNPPPMRELDISEDDTGTAQTVAHMQAMIHQGKKSALIHTTALNLTRHVRSFDVAGQIRAICSWTQRNIRFRGDPTGTELLQTPEATLTHHAGDCDDFSTLISAFLETLGIRTRLVAVATHPRHRDVFTHVYPEAQAGGRWIACDMARPGARLGRRPDPRRVYRAQTWQLAGQLGGLGGLGVDSAADLVSATGTSIADILAASHPQSTSTFYQSSTQANIPGVTPGMPGGAGAGVTVSGSTWLLIGGAALVLLLVMKR